VRDHPDDVIKGKQGMTLDLRVHVLALRTESEQLDQVDVVVEQAVRIVTFLLRLHQRHKGLERVAIIVEHQHFLSNVHQLKNKIIYILYAISIYMLYAISIYMLYAISIYILYDVSINIL